MDGRNSVARFVEGLVDRWELVLGPTLGEADVGPWTATRSGRGSVVLVLRHPEDGLAEEVQALIHWDGEGIVELIDHDHRGALLVERAVPGTPLAAEADEMAAMGTAAGILERLWIPDPGGIETVRMEVARWARTLPRRNEAEGNPVDGDLIREAVALLRELGPTQRDVVLLHGDLRLGNVLAAEREPWLAIDPTPLIGEREFDVAALIGDRLVDLMSDPAQGRARVQRRFDMLSERLECDRERLKGWSVAILVDYALWSFETDDEETGSRQLAVVDMLRSIRA